MTNPANARPRIRVRLRGLASKDNPSINGNVIANANAVPPLFRKPLQWNHPGTALTKEVLIVGVLLPEPDTVPGMEHVVFVRVVGTEHVRLTVPVKLSTGVTVTEAVPEPPRVTVIDTGLIA